MSQDCERSRNQIRLSHRDQANLQAARFQQTASYAYLATAAGTAFHADRLTLEAYVHFDISAPNFSRTVASLDVDHAEPIHDILV